MAATNASAKSLTKDEDVELARLRAAKRKRQELEKLRAEQAEADAAEAEQERDERADVEAARQTLERAGVDTSALAHDVDDEEEWLDDEPDDEGPEDATEVVVQTLTIKRSAPKLEPIPLELREEDGTVAGTLILPLVIPVELYEAMQSIPRPTNKNQQSRERHRNEVGIAVMAAWLNALFDPEGKALLTETGAIGQVFELWSEKTGWGRQPSSRAARRAR